MQAHQQEKQKEETYEEEIDFVELRTRRKMCSIEARTRSLAVSPHLIPHKTQHNVFVKHNSKVFISVRFTQQK